MHTSSNYLGTWLFQPRIGDLSPYVEDNIEDPSDLRSNPSEEGEVDAEALAKEAQGNLGDQQAKDNQD